MVGTLPKTSLLVTRGDTVLCHTPNYLGAAIQIGVTIDRDGYIMYRGAKQLPQYVLNTEDSFNGFEPDKAIVDWMKYHRKLPNVSIYRYLINC